ncbi:MAG: response regulator [Acidobacteria bacterium]|nr:response regulator [Acidobacteriota bacterium]
MNILVVDDSAMMRALIRRALRLSGADVIVSEASNGKEALTILETERIDAVFTDLNMPVMTGTELLREMSQRDWAHIKRVVVSTDGSHARREEVRDLHVSHYLSKPFAPEMFRDVLCEVCPENANA